MSLFLLVVLLTPIFSSLNKKIKISLDRSNIISSQSGKLVNLKEMKSNALKESINRLKISTTLPEVLDSNLNAVLKNEDLLLRTLPNEARILKLKKSAKTGSKYEKEIIEKLEKKGFEIIRNVVIEIFGKTTEIDLIAIKDEELMIVEISDGSNLKNKRDIEGRILRKIFRIELNKGLLNFHKAKVYIKAGNYARDMKEKYGNVDWIKDISIIIEESKQDDNT